MLTKEQIEKIKQKSQLKNSKLPFVFSALGDPNRLRAFLILCQTEDVCVTDYAKIFGVSVPAASHQLKVLELSGLAKRERHGQVICYKVNRGDVLVSSIINIIKNNN